MNKSKILSVKMIIALMLFIISFSIAVPILCRPFFYWHINLLNLTEYSGYDYATIKTAYDEMLNFCLGLTNTFSTGALKYSTEGMLHFVDCKKLFMLDFAVLAISVVILLAGLIYSKKTDIKPYRFNMHQWYYYSSVGTLVSFITLALLAMSDFDKAFVTFHHLFFPGKTNWIFDWRTDEIINVLPEQFFANCAILIVSLIIGLSVLFIYLDYRDRFKVKDTH